MDQKKIRNAAFWVFLIFSSRSDFITSLLLLFSSTPCSSAPRPVPFFLSASRLVSSPLTSERRPASGTGPAAAGRPCACTAWCCKSRRCSRCRDCPRARGTCWSSPELGTASGPGTWWGRCPGSAAASSRQRRALGPCAAAAAAETQLPVG